MDVYKYAVMNKLLQCSAIKYEEFRDFIKNIKLNVVVEIGTYKGISAAYIANFATVITFDIIDYAEKYKVWNDLGVKNKIQYYTVSSRDEIREKLEKINFDFAFIDGEHTYEAVKADFEIVKKCGRVLIHDVDNPIHGKEESYIGVSNFAKEIGAKFIKNLAYWEEKMKVMAKVSFLDRGKMRRRGEVFEINDSKLLETFLKHNLIEVVEKKYETKVVEGLTSSIVYDTKKDEVTLPSGEVIAKEKEGKVKSRSKRSRKK